MTTAKASTDSLFFPVDVEDSSKAVLDSLLDDHVEVDRVWVAGWRRQVWKVDGSLARPFSASCGSYLQQLERPGVAAGYAFDRILGLTSSCLGQISEQYKLARIWTIRRGAAKEPARTSRCPSIYPRLKTIISCIPSTATSRRSIVRSRAWSAAVRTRSATRGTALSSTPGHRG
jgi:hypothetical protein